MQSEGQINYCQHFQHFKFSKKLTIQDKSFCKFCINYNCPLWICLHKNCGIIVCGKANHLHLTSHLQQSKKNKSFHSIYINIRTSQIRCQYCNIQIFDLEKLKENQRKRILLNGQSNNPLKFRTAILPYLSDLGQAKSKIYLQLKVMGQLQFSQGHQKTNKCLVGIFADRYNYSLISAVQFITHCDFFREIIQSISFSKDTNKKITIIKQLKKVMNEIQDAKQRAIRIQDLYELTVSFNPDLDGYKRKNPFETVLFLLNILHQYLNFYKVTNVIENFGKDQWDLFYKSDKIESHCPLYDSVTSILTFQYQCTNCQHTLFLDQTVNFITLEFPKKKRKNKIVEQELNEKGYQSPKKRGKSLISFILPDQELPITIPQLLIDFLKQKLHPEKFCLECQNEQIPMKPLKMSFKKLADVLILHCNRFSKISEQLNETEIMMDYGKINLNAFCEGKDNKKKNQKESKNKNQQNIDKNYEYEFHTAIGIQKGVFPVVCRSKNNSQLYILKHEIVQMLGKTKFNPYVICLKRISTPQTQEFYNEIMKQNTFINQLQQNNQIFTSRKQMIPLPDFYHIQLKHGIQMPVYQPMSCKHSKLKPYVLRKCQTEIKITQKMYEHLIESYKGASLLNQVCDQCQQQIQTINQRKLKERQIIRELDKLKTNSNVMISLIWLKKWSNYLYSNQIIAYLHKGFPLPPPIDNKVLLENNKCKPKLVKNKDFKVVNVFIFKFLKQLYGGGPQIRYKWNQQLTGIDETKIKQLRLKAASIKVIYAISQPESPKKSVILQKNSSYMETVNESQAQEQQTQVASEN